MIEYRSGSLFDAPKGSILVHACNAQGVWGSGIAIEFKKRFPNSFQTYKTFCMLNKSVGTALLTKENIGCLITSENYGPLVDNPETILNNTYLALLDFFKNCAYESSLIINSNKFNSGLFKVPWKETEEIIKSVLKDYPNIKWIVYINE